jgi:membrane fusion protein (multidrug efflux system)
MGDNAPSSEVNRRKKKVALGIFGVVLLVGLVAGLFYIWYSGTHISTDDAFVEGTVHTVAPKVPGTVMAVMVKDNQFVGKGDLLLELEPDMYEHKVAEAAAVLKSEESRVSETKALIDVQERKIAVARADLSKALASKEELAAALKARTADMEAKKALLEQAQIDLSRAENLMSKQVIPRNRYDNAQTDYSTALASFKATEEMKNQAEVTLRVHNSTIEQARASLNAEKASLSRVKASLKAGEDQVARRRAQLELEKLNLTYTKIIAPGDGYVTRKSVEVGNQVTRGQPLMAIVPLTDTYIIANYKETEVENIKPGLKVKIKADAYPGKVFWGRVDSIMAGTGAVFSLFPPENATGNYVKVVQRVPVKIVLEKDSDPDHLLRVGLSIIPTILVE